MRKWRWRLVGLYDCGIMGRDTTCKGYHNMPYSSPIAFGSEPIQAAAVYCSDGRFGQIFDDFIVHGLGLGRCDRFAWPGGPGCLVGHEPAPFDPEHGLEEIRFLARAHKLDRIVLIQHDDCGFYSGRLGLRGEAQTAQQQADLATAAQRIADLTGITNIEGYFARLTDGKVHFEPADCTA